MKTFKKVLITIIAMLLIMGVAVGINYFVKLRKDKVFEEERTVRLETVGEETEDKRQQIEQISQLSKEEIEEFINENAAAIVDTIDVTEHDIIDEWTGEVITVTPEALENSISANSISENDVSGNDVSGNDVSGNDVSGNDVSGNDVSGNDVSGNDVSGNDVSGNDVSGNDVSGNGIEDIAEEYIPTLLERQLLRTSYEETQLYIEADQTLVDSYEDQLRGIKIACLGDSITDATNIEGEDHRQYSYPTNLGRILDAGNVTNLGIGGSSYGRYWDNPFCERYEDIPEDTDLIIVLGGANDGFCLTEDLVGDIDSREPRTLYGDVNELMQGLKDNYPDAKVVFMTPLPNLLHDVLRKERDYLLPQTVIVGCVKELASEYDYDVIDLYNSNFFDSHDADIVSNYIPDSVHPNEEGYKYLANHVMAELIKKGIIDELSGGSDDDEDTDDEGKETASPDASTSPEPSDDPDEGSDEDAAENSEETEGSDEEDGSSDKDDEDENSDESRSDDEDTHKTRRIIFARDDEP